MSRRVEHDGQRAFEIRFSFDRTLVDLVKTLPNRRWNSTERLWSAPESDAVAVVDLLADEGFAFCETTRRLYVEQGGARTLDDAPDAAQPSLFGEESSDDALTVLQLNERVRDVLRKAFPDRVWLVGEISGFNKGKHKRIVSFQLVEIDDEGKNAASVSATLFDGERRTIVERLAAAGDPFPFEDEVAVRLAVRVQLYVPWGSYRVVVEDIDVNYTLGEAARRREEVLRRLASDGLLGVNDALPFPELPLRVGLITSLDSDAYNDVRRTLQESGFAFELTAHGARVQGRQTEPSVLNALDWFRDRAERFDVVLICRGGGSRTDLAWFDSEKIGRAIAGFPLPIVSGIGHEQDQSVPDALARRAKTPTAAAALLVDRVRASLERVEELTARILADAGERIANERRRGIERAERLVGATRALVRHEAARVDERGHRLTRSSSHGLREAHERLARVSSALPDRARATLIRAASELGAAQARVVRGSSRQVDESRTSLERVTRALPPAARRAVDNEKERLTARERRLALSDPRRVLERGYAILRGEGGAVLTDAEQVAAGARLSARLRRGELKLVVEERGKG